MIYLLCLVLFCVGLYCILRKRNIIKIIVGIIIAEYAVNLLFILVFNYFLFVFFNNHQCFYNQSYLLHYK